VGNTINLSDVSTKDDSELKTGGRRKHTMPKGGKLSYKSFSDCLKSSDSDSDKLACAKHFKNPDYGIKRLSPEELKTAKKKKSKKKLYNVTKQKAIKQGYI